jgi:FixJ family two-component response regulator
MEHHRGHADAGQRQEVAQARRPSTTGGAAAYLRKPVDDQALLDAIQQAVTQATTKASDQ